MTTETLQFATKDEARRFMRRVHKGKYLHYDRTPKPVQTWVYGDGSVEQTKWGSTKNKGTVLSNFGYILAVVAGKLGSGDRFMDAIDERGGVTIVIDWED